MIFLLLVSTVQSLFTAYPASVGAEQPVNDHHVVQLTYDRTDNNYDDWDVWVWGTGVQDDQIEFSHIEDGNAVAYIEVAPSVKEIGFIIKKGDWENREPNGQDVDRSIRINHNEPITKAYVTEGVMDVHTIKEMTGPQLRDGNAQFYYRDSKLFAQNKMEDIDRVELAILGEQFEMTYNDQEERYEFYMKTFLKENIRILTS